MFGILEDTIDQFMLLKEGDAWIFAIDREVQDEIIRLNTEDQLYEEGIDSQGRSLGEYTPYTIEIKKSKGQRVDHITLKDTGAFYASFKVRATKTDLIIEADDRSKYDRRMWAMFYQTYWLRERRVEYRVFQLTVWLTDDLGSEYQQWGNLQ